MEKTLFKNEFFKSVRTKDGTTVVTVLKDSQKFYGIDLKGCKMITNAKGNIADEFTESAIESIKRLRCTDEERFSLKLELRNRTLNTLLGYI